MLKETFLNKLKQKHPDNFKKYDYSSVPDEFKAIDKVSIHCLKHGVFRQTPSNHLQPNNCPLCNKENKPFLKRLTTEDFIKKAIEIHGTKYTYPKTNYTGNKNKVIITCSVHGDFLQTPVTHLRGFGCSYCSGRKVNTEKFIKNSKNIHGNFYDYCKVNYFNNITEIIITCPVHGDFLQKPCNHLNGFGCPSCNNDRKRSNTEEFIRKARLIHGNKYNYNKTVYGNNNLYKVIIACNKHGEFLQAPSKHLSGQGCPKCKESNGEKYITTILDKHNIRYIKEYRITGLPYRYDFYLPDYDIYIEYHGIQHYKTDHYFSTKTSFEKTQKNDKTKIELIKRSTGLLIILSYKLNTIEKIEDELLRLFYLIHPEFLINKEIVKQSIANSKLYLIENGISCTKI